MSSRGEETVEFAHSVTFHDLAAGGRARTVPWCWHVCAHLRDGLPRSLAASERGVFLGAAVFSDRGDPGGPPPAASAGLSLMSCRNPGQDGAGALPPRALCVRPALPMTFSVQPCPHPTLPMFSRPWRSHLHLDLGRAAGWRVRRSDRSWGNLSHAPAMDALLFVFSASDSQAQAKPTSPGRGSFSVP